MAGLEWPEDVTARLRVLWDEGHSTSEIGRRLGVSKNAIVGKAHRLDLTARPSPIKRSGMGSYVPAPRPIAPKVTLPTLASTASAPVVPKPVFVQPPKPQIPLPLPNPIARGRCLYLIGDVKPFYQCDKPIEYGSYCKGHGLLCYVPAPRRDAA
jgi:GcrA cell cycle regulator